MNEILKQRVGVDISKLTFNATICKSDHLGNLTFIERAKSFGNDKSGFNQMIKWFRKNCDKNVETRFAMEATGVYHEALAYFLDHLGLKLSIILPNKVKNYAKCLNVKGKTDKSDAKIIARMSTEQQLDLWEPPAEIYRKLRSLTRQHQMLMINRTMFKNYIESVEHSEYVNRFVLKQHSKMVTTIDKQIELCDKEIKAVIDSDEFLKAKIDKLISIKGVGLLTSAIVVAETQGFANITSRKQLASYAGLDVVQKESGTSVLGKTRISKKGNSHIRRAMYLPSLSASSYNPEMRNFYLRVCEGKTVKKIGVIAVARKLLLLMFTLWKRDEVYIDRHSGDWERSLPSSIGASLE